MHRAAFGEAVGGPFGVAHQARRRASVGIVRSGENGQIAQGQAHVAASAFEDVGQRSASPLVQGVEVWPKGVLAHDFERGNDVLRDELPLVDRDSPTTAVAGSGRLPSPFGGPCSPVGLKLNSERGRSRQHKPLGDAGSRAS